MNTKSRIITLLVSVIATVTMTTALLTSCSIADVDSRYTMDMQGVYTRAQELGYKGTYEELVEAVKGEDGRGIVSVTINESDELIITFTDETYVNLGVIKGLSAFEIYLNYHPEFEGTEEDWINAIATGALTFEVDLTFDENGGNDIENAKTAYNANVLEVLSAYSVEKENYQFTGWTYADGSAIGAEDTVPAKGLSVKASYIGDDVIVVLYKDGKNDTNRLVFHYGDNLLEALTAARPYPGSTVTWEYLDGTPVGAEDTVQKSDLIQYFNAVVEENQITLTFADGGVNYDGAVISNSLDSSVTWQVNGETATLANYAIKGSFGSNVEESAIPTSSARYGYTFDGWYLEDGTAWDGTVPASDTTVYARWAQNGTLVVMYDTDKTTVVKAYVLESLSEAVDVNIKEYGVIDYTAPEGMALEGWKFMGRESVTENGYVETSSVGYVKDQFGLYDTGMAYYGYIGTKFLTESGKQYFNIGTQSVLSKDGDVKKAVYKFYASLWDAKYSNAYYEMFGTGGLFEATAYYTYGSNNTIATTTATEVTIPATCQGLPVIVQSGSGSSAKNGFDGLTTVKKVTFEAGVKEIGTYAFQGCTALEEVVFEGNSKMEVIGHYAFKDCTALKNFELPESVNVLGLCAFDGAFASDAELTFDLSNVEMIYGALFHGANGQSLTVNGLTAIPHAVSLSSTLINLDAKNYASGTSGSNIVTSYQEFISKNSYPGETSTSSTSLSGFFQGSTVATITIGEGTQEIGSRAFMGCSAEGFAINLPDSVTTLGYAFCQGSAIVEFDSNANAIPDQAFTDCKKLESYSGSNYVSIGENAFKGTALTTIKITSKMETIAGSAFAGCKITGVTCSSANTHYRYDEDTKFLISLDTKSIVIHADADATEIVLPEGITGLGGFYKGNTSITKVTLPKSLEQIDDEAFKNCTALTQVIFPTYEAGETPTLVTIGASAFEASGITSITIPACVQTIGNKAFYGTTALTEFVLEKDSELTEISTDMFRNSGVKNVYFNGKTEKGSSKITKVNQNAFNSAKNLEIIDWGAEPAKEADGSYTYKMEFMGSVFASTNFVLTLPANLNKILYNSFAGLTGLIYPEGLQIKTLPAGFLYGYLGTEFVLPKSVEIIGAVDSGSSSNAASNKITTFTSEEGSQLNTLGQYALKGIMAGGTGTVLDLTNCTQLSTVCDNAFSSCKMDTLKLPGNITKWGNTTPSQPSSMTATPTYCKPFGGAREVKTVEIAAKTIAGLGTAEQDWLLNGQKNLKKVVLPEGMTKVGEGAFAGCLLLADITLPSTVTEIGDYAFYCGTLSNANKVLTSLTLPAGLEKIGKAAFTRVYLVSVEIPAGVSEIGDYAFYQNTSLETLTLASGTTLETIGNYAFSGCTALTGFEIPVTLNTIGEGAFSGCTAASISLADGAEVENIGVDAFLNVAEVALMTNAEGYVYLGSMIYGYTGTATELVIPAKYTAIAKGAFKGNTAITKVSFANDEIELQDEAFFGCKNLAEVELPENATLGTAVFAECSALTTVTIPDAWTIIPVATFAKTGLTDVTFGETSKCETIDQYAFYGCDKLTSFTPPKALKTLGGASLVGTGITSINWTKDVIPNLAVIGDGAFAGLKLSSVVIESGVTGTTLNIGETSGSDRTTEATMNTNLENGYVARSTTSKTAGVFMWATLGSVTISAPNATGINSPSGYVFAYAKADAEIPFTVTFTVKDGNSTFFFAGTKTFYKSAVTAVNFPEKAVAMDGTTPKKLGSQAFDTCTALKEIYIPAYLSDLASVKFANSTALTKVVIGNGVDALNTSTTWASGIFYNCTALKDIIINQADTDALVKVGSTTTATGATNCFGKIYGTVKVTVNANLLSAYQAQTSWAKHITAGLTVVGA